MAKVSKGPKFETEAALCAAFLAEACGDVWVPYAETQSWDILLVRKADGYQIGIQAKLELNAKVLAQSLPEWSHYAFTGPDTRAVLVPRYAKHDLVNACLFVGITVITQDPAPKTDRVYHSKTGFTPSLPDRPGDEWGWGEYQRQWHFWMPHRRHKLPGYIPDVIAGASGPAQLSEWKIKAIKIAILLETRPVHRSDFKALKIDATRWIDRYAGWLDTTPNGYVASYRMPDWKAMHPVNYEQIKADRDKWAAWIDEATKSLLV